nr:nudix hydrolase 18, mitochondrial-like [Ipomoea batatas]
MKWGRIDITVVLGISGNETEDVKIGCLFVICVPYRYKDSGETSSLMAEDAFEGGWETDETIEAAALRETVEEAGVLGEIECKLGTWSFETKNGKNSCEGHMFPLLVKEQLDSWPEKEIRQRHWMSVREARKVCKQWWMKEALEALVGHVTKQRNAGILSAMGLSQGTLFSIRCGAQIVPPPTMASAEEA